MSELAFLRFCELESGQSHHSHDEQRSQVISQNKRLLSIATKNIRKC